MKYFIRIIAGFILTALLAPNALCADEKPAPAKGIIANPNAAWERRIPDIVLDNLPLGDIAPLLQERFPEVNFIVPESGRDTVVSYLLLRSVTLEEILKAIELVSEGRIRAIRQQNNIVGFLVAQPGKRDGTVLCRVFSLAPYLEGRSEKDAEKAIKSLYEVLEVAWDLSKKFERDVQPPTLSIHEGTKLLIAVGREKELAVIDQVVKELHGSTVSTTMGFPVRHESKTKAPATNSATPADAKP